jgi:hypothetical protein
MARASKPLCGSRLSPPPERRETRPVAPAAPDAAARFPVAVFPAPLRQFIREVAAALPCPPDFVGVPMLALLGCAIGTSRVLRVKPGWLEGPRIFAAVVADTGTKKSPALQLAAWPWYERQRALLRQDLDASDIDGDGGSEPGDAPPGQPAEPTAWQRPSTSTRFTGDPSSPPQVFTTDTTLEALIVLLAQNPRGVALLQDELSAWLRSMDLYRPSGRGADRQRWLSLWNGAPVMVNRKSRKQPIVIENPLVCLAGCLPPDVLGELSDERGREDGFIHRLLFGFPDPVPVRWTNAAVSEQALHGYQQVCNRLWDVQGNWRQAGAGPPSPIELSFTAPGRNAFIRFAQTLYAELADPDLPDHLRGPWAKFDGYGARVALILHLCRVVCGEADTEDVDEHSVTAMVQLMHYFKAHTTRVYTRLRSTRADQRAGTALRWIQAHGRVCTVRDLQRHRVAGITRASQGEKLLRDLVDLGQGEVRERRLPSGRTQRVFVLHADSSSSRGSSAVRPK